MREQEKEFARHVRENVRRRREEEQKLLEKHLKVAFVVFFLYLQCTVRTCIDVSLMLLMFFFFYCPGLC